MKLNLRLKFIVFFVVVVLVPLFLLSALALYSVQRTQIQAVAFQEEQFLRGKKNEIERFLKGISTHFEIRTTSTDPSSLNISEQRFIAARIFESNREITEVSFIDLSGQETLKVASGEGESMLLQNLSSLEKFKAARKGDTFFGLVMYDGGRAFMEVAQPIFNRSGLIIMLVSGKVDLEMLGASEGIVGSSKLGDEGYLIAADHAGNIFAASKKELVDKKFPHESWLKEILRGENKTGLASKDRFVGLENTPVFASGIRVSNVGWALITEWPQEDALKSARSLRRQAVILSFIVAMIVAILGFVAANKILRPISLLKKGAQIFGAGNFDHKITVTTGDELEELSKSFNLMGENLKKLEEWRMKAVKTQALEEALAFEKEVSKIKSDFITNTSHQLRTPVSIVNWNIDLMKDATTIEEQKPYLGALYAGTAQLREIVNDLLVISEFGVGYRVQEHTKIHIGEIISQVMDERKNKIGEKKLTIEKEIAENLPLFHGSRLGAQKVFENLIDNAITYTKEGGKVTVTLSFMSDCINFTIKDTGIGIPEGDKQSIFSAFFRAANAIEAKNVGTGLGLLICKNIVEGHGGKIWFESEVGKGSAFYVSLPLLEHKAS